MPNENPNASTSNSQRSQVARFLKYGNSLTSMQALNHFGCARLASRIDELRQSGMPIIDRWLQVRNGAGKIVRIKSYFLDTGASA